ncbi:MAG: 5-oxoprolinase subunit PxpB [Rhodanobacteraceae bacterium]|nr:MAG: 5-oxoprolinase subunit PxpB [Rhodanobacteraceae bacterium]
MADFSIEPIAEDALLVRFGDGIDSVTNARVHAAARALHAAHLAGLIDIAPAYATLLLRFETGSVSLSRTPALRAALDGTGGSDPEPVSRAPVDIPVCYGGACGIDLAAVADHTGLAPDAVVARHTAAAYSVAMLGFAPGFPYLLGLDPALSVPRRASPRTRVPKGAVAIGGAQTGIYPRELPGGWHLIGRTPLTLFDPTRDPPCLLAPGDRVRFQAIDAGEFAQLAGPRA